MGTRIAREQQTVTAMLQIYCTAKHGTRGSLCSECQELFEYALQRLNKCKFGEDKPVCGSCLVHCYKPDMRRRIVDVMRYSGPRMAFRHPFLAMYHLWDRLDKLHK